MSKRTPFSKLLFAAIGAFTIGAGCAHAPDTRSESAAMRSEAEATLDSMIARDPTLGDVIADAAGYVVFPRVGKGGAIVGGAQGVGVVYQNGRPVGYAELRQGSVGLQLGGQSFSELIVLKERSALERLKANDFDMTASASGVALQRGAGRAADFQGGSEVFYMSRGGLMGGLDVGGQRITFERGIPAERAQPR